MAVADKRALMRFLKRVVTKAAAGGAAGSRDPDDANTSIGAPGSEWSGDGEGGGVGGGGGGGHGGDDDDVDSGGGGEDDLCPVGTDNNARYIIHHVVYRCSRDYPPHSVPVLASSYDAS
jgi:hypothetical protein